jgi:hypothetical protein
VEAPGEAKDAVAKPLETRVIAKKMNINMTLQVPTPVPSTRWTVGDWK